MDTRYWEILVKKVHQEELSNDELELLSKYSEEQILKDEVLLKKSELYFGQSKYDDSKAWQKVQEQIQYKRGKIRVQLGSAIAVVILVGLVSLGIVTNSKTATNEIVTYFHNINDNSITLPDYSTVQLNQASRLVYPEKFNRKDRIVQLNGEGYFEIESNVNQPFFIETSEFMVKVVGTKFSVRAYPDENKQTVSVTQGQVVMMDKKLETEGPENMVVLYAGEQGLFDKSTGTFTKFDTYDPNYLGWFTHEISFENEALSVVLKTMEDVFFVKVNCTVPEFLDDKISAQFKENTPNYILKVVAKTFGLKLEKVSDYEYILTK